MHYINYLVFDIWVIQIERQICKYNTMLGISFIYSPTISHKLQWASAPRLIKLQDGLVFKLIGRIRNSPEVNLLPERYLLSFSHEDRNFSISYIKISNIIPYTSMKWHGKKRDHLYQSALYHYACATYAFHWSMLRVQSPPPNLINNKPQYLSQSWYRCSYFMSASNIKLNKPRCLPL